MKLATGIIVGTLITGAVAMSMTDMSCVGSKCNRMMRHTKRKMRRVARNIGMM